MEALRLQEQVVARLEANPRVFLSGVGQRQKPWHQRRRPAIKVEAELFTGPLPEGLEPPRLVVTPPLLGPASREGGDDLVILEVRALPPEVQPLPLSADQPAGALKGVGHPTDKPPWMAATFSVLKATECSAAIQARLP